MPLDKQERIAKVIARAGICSRRDAEKLIEQGKVSVDGQIISTPATKVSDKNIIEVNGKKLSKADTRLWLFNKPRGVITSHKDPQNRQKIFDILPNNMPRVISVGRLDYNTEGLILLTNDGELSRYIELPSTGWERVYRVRVYGFVDEKKLHTLKNGITIKDKKTGKNIRYGNIEAKIEGKPNDSRNSWIIISIKEGKNREVRKICEHIGLEVSRLIRISYGPFKLGNLQEGDIKEVSQKTIKEHIKL